MTLRCSHGRFLQRGYTLAELMIVVAMIGVMSALAIVGYRRYINSAQASEAKSMIQGIRAGEEAYKAEMLVYLSCSTSLTDYYPNANPDDSRWSWDRSADARFTNTVNGWRLLGVQADSPVRFGYAVFSGVGPTAPPAPGPGFVNPPVWPAIVNGIPWYVVQARNLRPNHTRAAMMISSSLSGEIYLESEDQ